MFKLLPIRLSAALPVVLASFALVSCSSKNTSETTTSTAEVSEEKTPYSSWMADSEIKRNPEGWTLDFNEKPKWEYTHGLIMTAMEEVYEKTNNQKYLDYIVNFADFMVEEDGAIKTYKKSDYNIDRVNGGCFLIGLYDETQVEKYKLADRKSVV